MDAKSYTRLLRSSVFRELVTQAQATLINECHGVDDGNTEGAVKAHYLRKGGEIVLNFMVTRLTVEGEERLKQLDAEPDFNAARIHDYVMNPR